MTDPRFALAALGFALLVSAGFFWPRWGLMARLSRLVRLTERVLVEDALKYLHKQEYQQEPASPEGMAGALEISRAKAVRLAARLGVLRLARADGTTLHLTESGRTYALRIVRSHRLWEQYLADRTGIDPAEWHEQAELREHTLTRAAADELDARMGHPRFDPHGDPIPTADGELPPQSGTPLSTLRPGQTGRVLHLEDEPREVYDRLMAAGLAPGSIVRVLEVTPATIRFAAEGDEFAFAPVVAAAVTVELAPDAALPPAGTDTLLTLRPGESAEVLRISPACKGVQRRRLLDLGVVPGTEIHAEFRGALGDPVAYRIRGALIALRRQQAEWILVDRPPAEAN